MGDTIAAIATPPGGGERGVIRVSGPRAAELARALWAGAEPLELGARGFSTGRIDDGLGTQPVLLLWMPGPRSFTREDVLELHLPGSPPLLRAALARLLELGARVARPGEFTRRAFEHGRIDLARAEGVLSLVHATTRSEARAAAALLLGGLSDRVAALREALEGLRALCEASLDFDESDTGHVAAEELERAAVAALAGLDEALAWEERRAPAGGEPLLVLAGAPNAGKSSLFNALVAEGRAIVSELAGTTRDGARGELELAGARARLLDAPGLEAAERGAALEAQRIARAQRSGADLLLWVVDATRRDARELGAELLALGADAPLLLAWNKVDLAGAAPAPPAALLEGTARPRAWVATSAKCGAGIAELRAALARLLGLWPTGSRAPGAGLARELSVRHRDALRRARAGLEHALLALRASAPLDQVAELLREATDALDEIAGRTTPEDLLDRIFARFCIGK